MRDLIPPIDVPSWYGAGTLVLMLVFAVLVYRVYRRKSRKYYEDAAQIPLDDEQQKRENGR